MKTQSRVIGIGITYLTTIVRTLSKLVLTPLYLRILGLDDYGFYQYVFSVASYATILDFGISSVVNTFAIKNREEGNKEGEENVLFYAFVFSLGAALLIVLCGLVITIGAPFIFGKAVQQRLTVARIMLVIIINSINTFKMYHELFPLFSGPGVAYNLFTVVYYIYYEFRVLTPPKYGLASAAAVMLLITVFAFTMLQRAVQAWARKERCEDGKQVKRHRDANK